MTREISSARKAAYYGGMICSGIGVVLFTMPFWAGPDGFSFCFFGFVMIAFGQFAMHIGRAGLAGAGVLLDPKRAREEQEPFSRMRGGMVRDTLDEAGLIDKDGLKLNRSAPPEQVVMIRCRACGQLNEEDSKFCQECGQLL